MSKEEIKLQVIAAPFFLLIGLGIFSLSVPDPSIVHPILAYPTIGHVLILGGGIGAAISMYKAFNIFKSR